MFQIKFSTRGDGFLCLASIDDRKGLGAEVRALPCELPVRNADGLGVGPANQLWYWGADVPGGASGQMLYDYNGKALYVTANDSGVEDLVLKLAENYIFDMNYYSLFSFYMTRDNWQNAAVFGWRGKVLFSEGHYRCVTVTTNRTDEVRTEYCGRAQHQTCIQMDQYYEGWGWTSFPPPPSSSPPPSNDSDGWWSWIWPW